MRFFLWAGGLVCEPAANWQARAVLRRSEACANGTGLDAIAQIAPLAESVPPKLYGGTEGVVHWLTEELVQQGHEVTLFASEDSRTSALLAPVIPRALRLGRPKQDPAAADERAQEFVVIHAHLDWLHLPLLCAKGVPFLTTLHGRIDQPGLERALKRFPGAHFISISDNQRLPLPHLSWLGTVYHGMPERDLAAKFERELDRRGVRAAFEERFTAARMARDYLTKYSQLIGSAESTSTMSRLSRRVSWADASGGRIPLGARAAGVRVP